MNAFIHSFIHGGGWGGGLQLLLVVEVQMTWEGGRQGCACPGGVYMPW